MTKQKEQVPFALVNLMNMLGEYSMRATYATLIALAESKRHLRHLHDMVLPADCRLLRSDVEELLEPAWEQVHSGRATSADNMDDDNSILLLAFANTNPVRRRKERADLLGYYLAKLDEGRDKLVDRGIRGHWIGETIYSEPGAQGHGYEHFTAFVCGHRFDLGVRLTPDETQVVVRLITWQSQLTEALTHRLLTELSQSMIGNRMQSMGDPMRNGSEVDFCWLTPAEGLAKHLRTHEYEGRKQNILIGDSTEFIAALVRRLQEIGVPLDQLSPVTYKEDGKEEAEA